MPGSLITAQHDDILVLTLDNPPANVMDRPLRFALLDALVQAETDASVAAILITSTGKFFSAGMDISEFQTGLGEPVFRDMLRQVEKTSKPIVAAMNGIALGGGLELALACEHRIAVASATMGLPEINLGVIPGAGGTQRLPRLVGVENAVEIITSAKPIPAQRALDIGLIDALVPDDTEFLDAALTQIRAWAQEGTLSVSTMETRPNPTPVAPEQFENWRADLRKRNKGRTSPLRALDAIELSLTLPFLEGLAAEGAIFDECNESAEGQALQHLFFAERRATKPQGIAPDMAARPIKGVAMIGAGTMGCGITINFLNAGFPVTMLDVSEASLARGLDTIRNTYTSAVKRERMTEEQAETRLSLLSQTQSYDDLAGADLLIEAVSESMKIKKAVFAELDRVAKPGAVLASNTSTLDIDEIAATMSRPADMIGLHFFSPAHVMPLVEIVRGRETADDVQLTALRMCKMIRKVGVTVGVCYGFVGNRMLEPYAREAHRLLLEGADVAQIDKVMTDFGMSMGPLAVYDLAGNDIGAFMREENRPANAHDPGYYRIGDVLTARGDLGQKAGRGFYIYEGRASSPNPDLPALIMAEAEELGIPRRDISEQEIFERILFPLVDEGLRILDEGIAQRPGDIDVIWCNGYGFPTWRGGPMHWSDSYGIDRIYDAMKGYETTLGAYGAMWFTPSTTLQKLATEGRKITDVFPDD